MGSQNTAIGSAVLQGNTSGSNNTGVGGVALYTNTSGSNNTGIGGLALYSNTSDSRNSAFGEDALVANTLGSYNIAMGYSAGSALTTGSNNIDIGNVGVAGESGIIRIGTPGTQTDTYLTGIIHGNGSGLTGISATIPPGSITSVQLAAGAVGATNLAAGAVGSAQLAPGALAAALQIAGTTQAAVANGRYVATSASLTNISLPTTANVGDVVEITGAGAGGWSTAPPVWTAQGTLYLGWSSVASSSDGMHLAATHYGGQIYTSANFGVTWTAQSGAPSATWVSVASSSDGTHLAALRRYAPIYTSANSGVNWTAQESNRQWTSVASSSDGMHLAAVVEGGQIYTSANFGVSWTAQGGAPSAGWQSVASSSDGTRLAAVANGGQIYTSTNFGVNWTAQSGALSADWRSVASSSDGTRLAAVAFGGQIYTSANSGVTWTAQSGAPSAQWYSVASSSDGTRLAAVAFGTQIYTSANAVPFAGAKGTTAALQYLGNGQWGAVGQTQIAAGAVSTANIAAGAVSNGKIAAGAVSTANIAAGAVSTANIASGAVSTGNIASGAVGTTQLAPGAVTAANLGADVGLWSVNGANVFRSGGNVGIGMSNPSILLDVAPGGVIGSSTVVTFIHDDANRGTKASFGYQAAGTGDFNGMRAVVNPGTAGCGNSGDVLFNTWECNTSASREVMRINGSGKVGIGTTSPGSLLSLSSPNTNGASISFTSGTATSYITQKFYPPGPDNALQFFNTGATGAEESFKFLNADATSLLTILANGNVGIGKTNPATKLDINGEATMTACNITSDRNAKEQFKPVNARAVLDKVARLPISEWQYKEQGDARHIGPMAQDFHAAFAVGRDEKHITTVDADGVALAAIQGLNEKLEERERDKDTRIRELENSVRELKELVNQLAGQQNGGAK